MDMKLQEVKLSYKPMVKGSDAIKVTSSDVAEQYFRKIWSDDLEHVENMFMLILNRNNKIVGYYHVSKGGIAGTIADVRIIMQTAILMNASAIILGHNHPSGNSEPSADDNNITAKIKSAALLFDIKLLDHLILTENSYLSFSDEGLL